ncbi:hypothetical protein CYY_008795 [Polysphondylium violaceum]|uniref:Palmitoyltransferase n=1 Tax=Polysphondylium violaceum TaxID=133409 RepID=A0A8J4UWN1_9MYCE|nr:hypothetical protein CYY_008795 [Polysphondylium violaceum]
MAQSFVDKLENVLTLFLRCIGPIFVFFASSLILWIAYVHFSILLPHQLSTFRLENENNNNNNNNNNIVDSSQSKGITLKYSLGFLYIVFQYSISIYLLFSIAFNYIMTIIVPPGNTPRDSDYSEQELIEYKSITHIKRSETYNKFCVTCRLPKIERAHHCQLCKTCVLRMDHHCPWVNNCVGQNNHRYFILFLLYLLVSCIYVCILSIPHVFGDIYGGYLPFSTLMTFVLTLTISLALGGLFFWQFYLVMTNQTTIEFLHNRTQSRKAKARGEVYKNPYHLGIANNLREFFKVTNLPWYYFAAPMSSGYDRNLAEKKRESVDAV